MAGYSARQASFTTGDTILAAHSNDEFNQVLAAFNATTGHTHDGTAGEGGPISTLRDSDSLNKIFVDTSNNHLEFYVEVSSAAVQQLRIQDGAIVPITDNDIDLGTSSLEFKDLFIDGTANVDAINLDGTLITSTAAELNILDGVTATAAELNILDGVTSTTAELNILDGVTATAAELNILDGVTSTAAELNILDGVTSTAAELNLVDGITAGTVSASKAVIVDSDKDLTGLRNLTISGDLTVSGDDITMGTNTAGNLLIADGTNFNSVAVGSLSEISTVASDDVLLAVDTSGGGLKKITRSTLTAGLVSGSEISNIVEDSTPQLGGDLDVNGNGLVSTSNGNIALTPNGTGVVRIDGSNGIDMQSGAISIKNSGAQSYVRFYCESSNAHYAQLQAPAHSAFSGNITLTLPATTDTVAGIAATQTFTNKTLTSPKINEDVAVTATATEINLLDGVTSTTAELNILDGVTSTAAELNILDGVTSTAAELNILDGVTSTAAELNILDGVTSTASELNLLDGGTSVGSSLTLADSDGIIMNDGGTMKSMPASDIKTYVGASAGGFSIANLDIDGGTDIGEAIVDADLFIVDNGAGGTNRKVAASRLVTYVDANSSAASVGKAIAMAIVFG